MIGLYKEKNKKPILKEFNFKLKEGELLVNVFLSGICRTDLYVANDLLEHKNVILGHEFSGIISDSKSNLFIKNDFIACLPVFLDSTMLGVEHNGCFSQQVIINEKQAYILDKNRIDPYTAAYLEPICASMSPLNSHFMNKNMTIGILGQGRIAELTQLILNISGYKTTLLEYLHNIDSNFFDCIIETNVSNNDLIHIPRILKKNGLFIVKSRNPNLFNVNFYEFVKKDLKIECLYYYDMNESISFAYKYKNEFQYLFGSVYKLNDWEIAFNSNENKKIFLEP